MGVAVIKYEHLVGRPFSYGKQDCYSIVRDFYRDNFQIELPNYARPKDFWAHGLNLYYDKYMKNGFVPLDVHPSQYQPGDVVLMAVRSSIGNHAGVLVERGQMLHHLWNQLSVVVPYTGMWRNATLGVFRHKDVVLTEELTTHNLLDFVPPHIKRKLDEHLAAAPGEV